MLNILYFYQNLNDMAKKKTLEKEAFISAYIDYVLEHNCDPESVYKFCKSKDLHSEESNFYAYFSSFDSLKSAIFELFFDNTIELLEKSEDYRNFDAQNKLLSYYFTFFEILTANRSYVVYALQAQKHSLETLKALKGLRSKFKAYINTLEIETLDLKNERLNQVQHRAVSESAWIQLLMILKFWLEDTSPSFEKTEIFIEKSLKAGFDMLHTKPLKSMMDLGKFLFKEKMSMQ